MNNKESLKEFVAFLKQYEVPLNADKTLLMSKIESPLDTTMFYADAYIPNAVKDWIEAHILCAIWFGTHYCQTKKYNFNSMFLTINVPKTFIELPSINLETVLKLKNRNDVLKYKEEIEKQIEAQKTTRLTI